MVLMARIRAATCGRDGGEDHRVIRWQKAVG